jgi:hypothetical protein
VTRGRRGLRFSISRIRPSLPVLIKSSGVGAGIGALRLLRAIGLSSAGEARQSRVDTNAGKIALSRSLLVMKPDYRAGQTGWW